MFEELIRLTGTSEADDRGVSPVLGVALLIGITVTLVAVVGIVVLGVDPTASIPSADFEFEDTGSGVRLTHNGGDSLDPENVVVKGPSETYEDVFGSETINAGDTGSVSVGSGQVQVVWKSPDSDKSVVLSEYTAG